MGFLNSAISSDAIDLTPFTDLSGTYCMKSGTCPKCVTGFNLQKTYRNYTSHKTRLLLTGVRKVDDEKRDWKRFKNQKRAGRQRRGLEIAKKNS